FFAELTNSASDLRKKVAGFQFEIMLVDMGHGMIAVGNQLVSTTQKSRGAFAGRKVRFKTHRAIGSKRVRPGLCYGESHYPERHYPERIRPGVGGSLLRFLDCCVVILTNRIPIDDSPDRLQI